MGKQWRIKTSTDIDRKARLRDNDTCQECGSIKNIVVHHITEVSKWMSDEQIMALDVLDNVITLCQKCHTERHNYKGCMKKGHDKRRHKLSPPERKKGAEKLKEICKTKYFNRHIGEWLKI